MSGDSTDLPGIADLRRALRQYGLNDHVLEFDSSTATSRTAADNVGCDLGQIVKSLGFMIDKARPMLALVSGDKFVDDRKLAALHGVGRKKIRLMTHEQCLRLLGYPPGAVPPLGLRTPGIPVILDDSLRRFDIVYASGGAANAIFPIPLQDLLRVADGRYADIVKA